MISYFSLVINKVTYPRWFNHIISAIATSVILAGCGGSGAEPTDNISAAIQVKNGYLVFKNDQEFSKTASDISHKTDIEKAAWESQFIGYTSLHSDFTKVIQEVSNIENSLAVQKAAALDEKYIDGMFDEVLDQHKHSTLKASFDDNSEYLKPNIADQEKAFLVNHLGLVQIGDKLFQYSHDRIKYGPATLAPEILLSTPTSNDKMNIEVHPIILNKISQHTSTEKNIAKKLIDQESEPVGSPGIPTISHIEVNGLREVNEGDAISYTVNLEDVCTAACDFPFMVLKDSRVGMNNITFTQGAYLFSNMNIPYLKVPANVKSFNVTVPTLKNKEVNDTIAFWISIGHLTSPNVTIMDKTKEPEGLPTKGNVWWNEIQQTNDGGNRKLVVLEELNYELLSTEKIKTKYHFIVKSYIRGTINKKLWHPNVTNLYAKYRMRTAEFDTEEKTIYFRHDNFEKTEEFISSRMNIYYVPTHVGYLKVSNDWIPLIEFSH